MKAYRTEYEGRNIGVIAILTNNGILSCYNEQLRLKWKVSIYETNLINMSNLFITTSALSFSHTSLYVAISYSLYHTSVIKTRHAVPLASLLVKERLTSEEIAVLRSNSINLGQSMPLPLFTCRDVDLTLFQSHPQLYILEKYKVRVREMAKTKSILDQVLAINDMQVLKLNVENGDIVWRNSLPQHIKHPPFVPQLEWWFHSPFPIGPFSTTTTAPAVSWTAAPSPRVSRPSSPTPTTPSATPPSPCSPTTTTCTTRAPPTWVCAALPSEA